MSFLRIILLCLIGYFLWRIVRSTTRIMSNRRKPQEEDPFAAGGTQKPPQPTPYRDVKDANFEEITRKKDKEQSPPPDSNE